LNKTVFLCTGGAAMPEMMRWLWRDSTPVTTDPTDLGSRGYLPPAAGVPTQAAAVALRGYDVYEELLLDLETRGHTARFLVLSCLVLTRCLVFFKEKRPPVSASQTHTRLLMKDDITPSVLDRFPRHALGKYHDTRKRRINHVRAFFGFRSR
jgi:hypothetical protein